MKKETVVYLSFEHYDRTGEDINGLFNYVRNGYKYCQNFDTGGTFSVHILSKRPLKHEEARSVARHIWSKGCYVPHPKFKIK